MSDPRHRTMNRLDAETLAAFVDGRVDAAERARIEAHLAECEDCYEVFVQVAEVTGELGAAAVTPAATTVSVPRSRRSPSWSLGLAAAAILAVGVSVFLFRDSGGLGVSDDLVAAVGSVRFVEARTSEGFKWGPIPAPVRGTATEASVQVQRAAAAREELATRKRTAETVRAAGVGQLATGRLDDAIATLGEAVRLDPVNDAPHLDLAAALLERWRRDRSAVDAERALAALDLVAARTPRSPVLLFNRALALEAAGSKDLAVRAWQSYLDVDGSSEWAGEARAHLARLQSSRPEAGQ